MVCERFQNKTRFGYQWTPWRVTARRLDIEHLPDAIEIGFSTLRVAPYGPKVDALRLPL